MQDNLDLSLAFLGIVGVALVGCFLNDEVGEVVDEMIAEYEENVEIREVQSSGSHVGGIAGLEMEATSGFGEHIHNRLHLDQVTNPNLPFVPVS